MAIFNYKVRDKNGKLMSDSIVAPEESVVVKNLRQMGYTIISLERDLQVKVGINQLLGRFNKVSRRS